MNIRNINLLFSILSGHYYCWITKKTNSNQVAQCDVCRSKLDFKSFQSTSSCCGLVIPGKVPQTLNRTKDNIIFLKFIDSLKYRQFFYNDLTCKYWNFDNDNDYDICSTNVNEYKGNYKIDRIAVTENKNYDRLNNKNEIICYTDGSAELHKCAGAGIYFVNGGSYGLENKGLVVTGEKTNQRAELYAISVAIDLTEHLDKKLRIKTDSKYSIDCVTDWYRRWQVKGNSFLYSKKNIDLIEYIYSKCLVRDIEFQKVKGHAGIYGNELSDSLANYGRVLDQSLVYHNIDINKYYLEYLKNLNLFMSNNEGRNHFNLANQDRNLIIEVDRKTNKPYVSIPIFRLPNNIDFSFEGMTKFLINIWNDFKVSYANENMPAFDNFKLPHILDLISGYDFVTSIERMSINNVVGVNIKTIGRYDCTVVGMWIHLVNTLPKYDNFGNNLNCTIGDHYNFDFHWTKMARTKEDSREHFKMRLDQAAFHIWVNSRIGRVSARSEWRKVRIDNDDMKNMVQNWIEESERSQNQNRGFSKN